jgi:hypothetical protein
MAVDGGMGSGLLPPPGPSSYRGAPFAWGVLAALGALDLARGGIHLLAPDGGAGRIAGIDLTRGGEVIVMLFAVMGISQLAWGVLNLLVALRYRSLVPLLLALQVAQQALAIWVLWLYKPLTVPAPGKYGVLASFPILSLALWLSLRPRAQEGDRRADRPVSDR